MRQLAVPFFLAAICVMPVHAEEFRRVSLPGFSAELPDGKVVNTSKLGFAGRHEVLLPAPTVLERMNPMDHRLAEPRVVLSWNRHDLALGESYPVLRDTMLKSLTIENAGVLKESHPSSDVWISVLGNSRVPIGYGSRECERGFSVDVVVAVARDVEEQYQLTQRIIRSVNCALTDNNRHRPEAATKLPLGFARIKGEQFPTYATVQGEQLVINFTTGDTTKNPEAFRAVVNALGSQITGVPPSQVTTTLIPIPASAARNSALARVTVNELNAFVGALWCPKLGISFMTIHTALQPSQPRARVLIDSIYCPGSPGETPPDAKPIFESACSSGNDIACQTLKEFTF